MIRMTFVVLCLFPALVFASDYNVSVMHTVAGAIKNRIHTIFTREALTEIVEAPIDLSTISRDDTALMEHALRSNSGPKIYKLDLDVAAQKLSDYLKTADNLNLDKLPADEQAIAREMLKAIGTSTETSKQFILDCLKNASISPTYMNTAHYREVTVVSELVSDYLGMLPARRVYAMGAGALGRLTKLAKNARFVPGAGKIASVLLAYAAWRSGESLTSSVLDLASPVPPSMVSGLAINRADYEDARRRANVRYGNSRGSL